jgi:hypothetical protein
MSYLTLPHIHFAGRFQADVSTLNNDPDNFSAAQPALEWNPMGTGSFRLLGCTVVGARRSDGSLLRELTDDPVIGLTLSDADARPAGKIVDLDPEQQMVSSLWGVQMRLGKPGVAEVFRGEFAQAAFSDLWQRTNLLQKGWVPSGAFFQSVLTQLRWGELLDSRLLSELREAAPELLSIKFNVDGYVWGPSSVSFTTGRIVGTIGPGRAEEPKHFVIGRQCMPVGDGSPVNFFPAIVDASRGKLVVDLGNALPTVSSGGALDTTLKLEIGLVDATQHFQSLGPVAGVAYEENAGIFELPTAGVLSAAQMTLLEKTPIGLAQVDGPTARLIASEGADGLCARADEFVFRMSPGESATSKIFVTQFGRPIEGAALNLAFDSSGLQGGAGNLTVAKPTSALAFPTTLTTDAKGRAQLTLTADDPGNPRGAIDGQVYGVRYTLPRSIQGAGGYSNPANFISVLVWDRFPIATAPTWWEDVEPILAQFARLYPAMRSIVDMSDYNSVVANKRNLLSVLALPIENPNHMPVTRDLSPAKRAMIIKWLGPLDGLALPMMGKARIAVALDSVPMVHPATGDGDQKRAASRRKHGPIILTRN